MAREDNPPFANKKTPPWRTSQILHGFVAAPSRARKDSPAQFRGIDSSRQRAEELSKISTRFVVRTLAVVPRTRRDAKDS